MRPLKLVMQNIGPFRTATIDFTKLEDMFLVTGKTGSGKTTIFDAMTYALYGDISGSLATARLRLRSDFCDEKEKSTVEFTFLLNNRTYRIYRSVQNEHHTKNGTVAKGIVEVTLEILDAAKNSWQSFSGTPTQLTAKIESLIGLSRDEFTQIVVLPQGEFAKFLHEGSNERRETLSKLFPVRQYENIAQKVASLVKEKNDQLASISSELQHIGMNFKEEDAVHELERIDALLQENATKRSTVTKDIELFSKQLQLLTSQRERAFHAKTLREKYDELEKEEQTIADLEKQMERSEKAAPLAQLINRRQNVEVHLKKANDDLAQNAAQLAQVNKKLEQLSVQSEAMQKKNDESAQLALQIHDVTLRIDSLKEKTDAEVSLQKASASLAFLFEQATAYKAEIYSACKNKESDLDTQNKTLADTEKLLDEAEAQQKRRQINNAASFLSSTLVDGVPCPVCGSLTHPRPVCPDKEALPLDEKIKTYHLQIQNSNTIIANLLQEKSSLVSLNQIAISFCTSLENTMQQHAVTNSLQNAVQKKLPSAGTFAKMQAEADSLLSIIIKARSTIDSLSKPIITDSMPAAFDFSLTDIFNTLTSKKRELDESAEKYKKEFDRASQEKSTEEGSSAMLIKEKDAYQNEYDELSRNVKDALASSVFKSEKEALDSVMEAEIISQAKKRAATFRTELTKTEAELNTITADELPLEQIEQKLLQTQQSLDSTNAILDRLDESNRECISQKTTITDTQKRIQSLLEMQNNLVSKQKALFALNDDLNGSNAKHIQFQSWALGTFLNDVVSAANNHFMRISDNRFRFVLQTDSDGGRGYKGLELTVSDSYTGKERDSKSLSGGETFMASLSLALALTDVVQQKSGGIKLDSLFIDEGFGSLDNDSLDNAVAILEDVREQRMVGIISHVESLEQVIHSHVQVIKSDSGSRIC